MARHRGRVDDNQRQLVKDLRACHYSVAITSGQGDGFADIVVGCYGKNILFEIKDPVKFACERRLTEDEKKFHDAWHGQIDVVETLEDCRAVIMQECGRC
jgi:hypothetical protein